MNNEQKRLDELKEQQKVRELTESEELEMEALLHKIKANFKENYERNLQKIKDSIKKK